MNEARLHILAINQPRQDFVLNMWERFSKNKVQVHAGVINI